jgi:hypothetical protein
MGSGLSGYYITGAEGTGRQGELSNCVCGGQEFKAPSIEQGDSLGKNPWYLGPMGEGVGG